MPLLCIEKKNGTLRTVVNARLRNANMFLDVTPLPDLDMIRDQFARAKFQIYNRHDRCVRTDTHST
jgi:hypothetical protein